MTCNKITNQINLRKAEDSKKDDIVITSATKIEKTQTHNVDKNGFTKYNQHTEDTNKEQINIQINENENLNKEKISVDKKDGNEKYGNEKNGNETSTAVAVSVAIAITVEGNEKEKGKEKGKEKEEKIKKEEEREKEREREREKEREEEREETNWQNKRRNNRAEKKKNKKVMDLSYIIHYNRYQPVKREMPKKKNINTFVKKNINQYINYNFRYYVSDKDYLLKNVIGENVNWEKIQKVDYIVPQETTLSCPICLENNILSPRITKCRHIFCFFCILKYFIQEEKKTWKKCPICFEIIMEKDLRIVKFQYVKKYNINDSINLCLLYTDNKVIHSKHNKLNFNNNFKITNNTILGKGEKETHDKNEVQIQEHKDYINKNLNNISKIHNEKIEKLNLNLGVQFFKLFYIYNPLSIWLKDLAICNVLLNQKKINTFVTDEDIIQEAKERIELQICNYLDIPIIKFQSELAIEGGLCDSFYIYDNLAHDVYVRIFSFFSNRY